MPIPKLMSVPPAPIAIVPISTWMFVLAPIALLFAASFVALVIGSLALLRSTRDVAAAVSPPADTADAAPAPTRRAA